MERRLSPAGAREHETGSPSTAGHRTRAIMPRARRLRKPIAPHPGATPGRYSQGLPHDRLITSFISRSRHGPGAVPVRLYGCAAARPRPVGGPRLLARLAHVLRWLLPVVAGLVHGWDDFGEAG